MNQLGFEGSVTTIKGKSEWPCHKWKVTVEGQQITVTVKTIPDHIGCQWSSIRPTLGKCGGVLLSVCTEVYIGDYGPDCPVQALLCYPPAVGTWASDLTLGVSVFPSVKWDQ